MPSGSWPRLVESLRRAPVVKMDEYDYFVHPLTDGSPPVEPVLLREAIEALRARLPAAFDRILAPEAMGLPLAAGLSLATGKPFLVARKRAYGLPGEVVVPYRTGYASGHLHVNGLRAGETVVVIDDVSSRGGTVRALAEAVRRAGAHLVKVVILFNKGLDLGGLSEEIGANVEAVLQVRVADGRVEVVSSRAAART